MIRPEIKAKPTEGNGPKVKAVNIHGSADRIIQAAPFACIGSPGSGSSNPNEKLNPKKPDASTAPITRIPDQMNGILGLRGWYFRPFHTK